MSKVRRKSPFPQADDDEPTHDQIALELHATWQDRLKDIPGVPNFDGLQDASIVGEAIVKMNGFPPLFPDAIADATLLRDHRGLPVKLVEGTTYEGRRHLSYECAAEGCFRSFSPEQFKFDEPPPPWDPKEDPKVRDEKARARNEREEAARRGHIEGLKRPRHWTNLCPAGEVRIVFEVKPTIKSFGEVLRQLRLYDLATQLRPGELERRFRAVVLVTPDTKYDAEFLAQGFPVIHPRPAIPPTESKPSGTLESWGGATSDGRN